MFREGTTCRSFEEFRIKVMLGKINFVEGTDSDFYTSQKKDNNKNSSNLLAYFALFLDKIILFNSLFLKDSNMIFYYL